MRWIALPLCLGLASLPHQPAIAAPNFFRRPPTQLTIHNPSAVEGQRNRTTLSVHVPADAGAALEQIQLTQLSNLDHWNWGRRAPDVYRGTYALRGRQHNSEITASMVSDRGDVQIRLLPPALPGETVNLVFRGFNPEQGIYQWSSVLVPQGDAAISSVGPTLRLHVYGADPFF